MAEIPPIYVGPVRRVEAEENRSRTVDASQADPSRTKAVSEKI